MDKLLILTVFAVQAILFLMWVFTLKNKLNSIEEEIQAINTHIDGQADKVIAEIEERGQFNDKALGQLAENVAACGYEIKEVKDKIEIVNNNTLLVRQSNFEIDSGIAELNKTIKQESAKNIALHLRKF